MPRTIAVVRDFDKKGGGWKVLVNYIQRGIVFHNMETANNQALELSEKEHCDHLILAKNDA